MSIVTYGYGTGQLIVTWGYGSISAVGPTYTRVLTETILLNDTLSKFISINRLETISLGDILETIISFNRILIDNINLTSSLERLITFQRIYSETILLADTISKAIALQTFQETLGTADSIIKGPGKNLFEQVGISDVMIRTVTFNRNFLETVIITDSLTKIWAALVTFPETLTLTDSLNLTMGKSLTDILFIMDIWERIINFKRELTETVVIQDVLTKIWDTFLTLTESTSLSADMTLMMGKTLIETVTLVDILSTIAFFFELGEKIYLDLLSQTQSIDLLNSRLQPDLHISGTPLDVLKKTVLTTTLQQKRILKTLREEGARQVWPWPPP